MTSKLTIPKSYKMGFNAYCAGIKAPYKDEVFRNAMSDDKLKVGEGIKFLNAWSKGFAEANDAELL